ncbi:DinB family protein [Maribacter sp. 2-571]|uniref:DinB family protein n=1 Tax=Maribacter sp. 2-571 TaxID=3417569 RepID=UPI003D34B961
MLKTTLKILFNRDLDRLYQEIAAYTNEKKLWEITAQISNSGGTLCKHLLGNMNAFIGAELGDTGYVRRRELEFDGKPVSTTDLLAQIKTLKHTVDETLERLDETALDREYPLVVFEKPMTTGYFLMHLTTHLTYHLGQINYHRRLLDL